MDNDEYLETQIMVVNIAVAINRLNLGPFLERIAKAHAIAPIVDPTLYRKGMHAMGGIEDLAGVLRDAQHRMASIDLGKLNLVRTEVSVLNMAEDEGADLHS